MEWSQIASSAMTGIFSSSFIMAIVAVYTAKQSRKAQVSSDEREARRDLITDRDKLLEWYIAELEVLNQDNKLLLDYVYELRAQIPDPKPFPKDLNRV